MKKSDYKYKSISNENDNVNSGINKEENENNNNYNFINNFCDYPLFFYCLHSLIHKY